MKRRTFTVVGLAIGLLTTTVVAQRMSAEQILDRAESVSGAAKARTLKTVVLKGTIQMTAQNLKGTMELYFKAPNKVLIKQSIPNALEQASGFDGKVGWEKSNLTGIRELKGQELEQLKSSADLNNFSNWRKQYRNPKLRGTDKVGTASVYVIDATTAYGTKATLYIDTKSFRLLRSDSEVATPQGSVQVSSLMEDYRKVDGILYPSRIRQSLAGMEMIVQVQQIRHNVPLSDSIFRKPRQ